jgi:hypothetical protein
LPARPGGPGRTGSVWPPETRRAKPAASVTVSRTPGRGSRGPAGHAGAGSAAVGVPPSSWAAAARPGAADCQFKSAIATELSARSLRQSQWAARARRPGVFAQAHRDLTVTVTRNLNLKLSHCVTATMMPVRVH